MAYVILEKIKSTAHIESVVLEADAKSGIFVELGEKTADGELYKAKPSADTTKELVFLAPVPLTYRDDELETDFVLKAGKAGRGYVLETGNEIAISADGIEGVATVGATVIPAVGGFAIAETATGLHGRIVETFNDAIVGKMYSVRISA